MANQNEKNRRRDEPESTRQLNDDPVPQHKDFIQGAPANTHQVNEEDQNEFEDRETDVDRVRAGRANAGPTGQRDEF